MEHGLLVLLSFVAGALADNITTVSPTINQKQPAANLTCKLVNKSLECQNIGTSVQVESTDSKRFCLQLTECKLSVCSCESCKCCRRKNSINSYFRCFRETESYTCLAHRPNDYSGLVCGSQTWSLNTACPDRESCDHENSITERQIGSRIGIGIGIGILIIISSAILIMMCRGQSYMRSRAQGVNWDDEDYNNGVTERGKPVHRVKGKGQVSRGGFNNQTYEDEIAAVGSNRTIVPVVPPAPAQAVHKTREGYEEYNLQLDQKVTTYTKLSRSRQEIPLPVPGKEYDYETPYEEIKDIVCPVIDNGPAQSLVISPNPQQGKPTGNLPSGSSSGRSKGYVDVDCPGAMLTPDPKAETADPTGETTSTVTESVPPDYFILEPPTAGPSQDKDYVTPDVVRNSVANSDVSGETQGIDDAPSVRGKSQQLPDPGPTVRDTGQGAVDQVPLVEVDGDVVFDDNYNRLDRGPRRSDNPSSVPGVSQQLPDLGPTVRDTGQGSVDQVPLVEGDNIYNKLDRSPRRSNLRISSEGPMSTPMTSHQESRDRDVTPNVLNDGQSKMTEPSEYDVPKPLRKETVPL